VRRRLGAALAAGLLLVAVGCGGDDGDDSPDDAAVELPDVDAAPADEEADDFDACALLEESEVEPYVGATGPGEGRGGTCSWENPENFESVTITLGSEGTAVDALPEPSPYGDVEVLDGVADDARYAASLGIVEFRVGDRAHELQLAAPVTLDDAAQREGAIALTELVVGRL
jgi:hypothetical protein